MRLNTKVTPPFFPDPDQNTVLQLGIKALDASQWMQPDEDFEQFLQHKKTIKTQQGDRVYATLPGSEAAQAEFHQCLLQHLSKDYGRTELTSDFESLWQSSLLVQEDICLLEDHNGDYILTAASVCSPSNWPLENKIGRSLDLIHKPVPDYQASLSRRVNRLFDKLKADAPLLRFNWSVQKGSELFWRSDLPVDSPGGADSRADNHTDNSWYWRVERQTLRRLPQSQAVVFTIRIYLHDIEQLNQQNSFQPQLQAIIERLPENQVAYKGLGTWLKSILP